MAIEDLFKIVKERFVAEQPAVPASQEGFLKTYEGRYEYRRICCSSAPAAAR